VAKPRNNPETQRRYHERHRADPGYRMMRLISGARARARRNGTPWDEAFMAEFIAKPPLRCQATGMPFDYAAKSDRLLSSPSLDQIVPGQGYVRGNVAVVLDCVNRAKQDLHPSDTRLLAELLTSAADFYERRIADSE
jgi:hypothetical protein